MGRRKTNVSQPMVLDIMLSPFNETFYIDPSDTTQQWWYANNNRFIPDHSTDSPLYLTPHLKLYDPDTTQVYTPTFTAHWFYYDPTNGTYDEFGNPVQSGGKYVYITNTTDDSDVQAHPYVIQGNVLKVKKNIPYNAPVSLLCVGTYTDPRNSSSTPFKVRTTQDLVTNRDATEIMPTIEIMAESTRKYNVIKDGSSIFTFTAKVLKGTEDITSSVASSIRWYAFDDVTTTETLINAATTVDGISCKVFPAYVSGQNSASVTIDAMYLKSLEYTESNVVYRKPEKIHIVARLLCTDSSSPYYNQLYPTTALRSVVWDDIPIDPISHSRNSGAVRDNTQSMTFDMIMNIQGATLSEAQKLANFSILWKRRNAQASTVYDVNWGNSLVLDRATLRAFSTSLIFGEVFLRGANEYVTCNNEIVTCNGEPVYCRTL